MDNFNSSRAGQLERSESYSLNKFFKSSEARVSIKDFRKKKERKKRKKEKTLAHNLFLA
jgi:hypothetical protein